MRQNSRMWFAVFVGVVFGAGIGTGFLVRPYVESTPSATSLAPTEAREPDSPSKLTAILAKELDLTEAQRREIEDAFNARRDAIHAFREEVRARTEEQRRAVIADIERVLSPDQRRRFEAFVARRRATRED